MSLQQRLSAAIRKAYPDAIIKKIDQDNFVDIHIPSVHSKRGSHLFFNTARDTIKVGFYCRDEEFVGAALANTGLLESYAQGVRPSGNPSFTDADRAVRAALDLLILLGRPAGAVASPAINDVSSDDDADEPEDAEHETPVTTDAGAATREWLLEQFAERVVATKPPAGTTLIQAVKQGDVRAVEALLKGKSIDVESTDDREGLRALHYAAWDGQLEITKMLLDHGANPNALDNDGYTPLHLGVVSGHVGCVRLLLDRGAAMEYRTKRPNGYHGSRGGTALRDAVINQYWEIVDLLIQGGADTSVLLEPCTGAPGLPADLFEAIRRAGGSEPSLRDRFDARRLAALKTACSGSVQTATKQPNAQPKASIISGPKLPKEWMERICAATPQLKEIGANGVKVLTSEYRGIKVASKLPNRTLPKDVCDKLCERIRKERVIPVYFPAELQTHCRPFDKWTKVWWFIPGIVLGNGSCGPMCFEMQGFSMLKDDVEFQLGINFDRIKKVPKLRQLELSFGGSPAPSPRWREWTFEFIRGGEITVWEHQPDPKAGFHLDIVKAISDIWWPVVDRSRNSPIIVHSADDPDMRKFESLEAVAAWALGGE